MPLNNIGSRSWSDYSGSDEEMGVPQGTQELSAAKEYDLKFKDESPVKKIESKGDLGRIITNFQKNVENYTISAHQRSTTNLAEKDPSESNDADEWADRSDRTIGIIGDLLEDYRPQTVDALHYELGEGHTAAVMT